MKMQVKEGDFDGLQKVMVTLANVRERINTTDNMFDPLKETINFLQSVGQDMSDEVHLQLAVCTSSKYNNYHKYHNF